MRGLMKGTQRKRTRTVKKKDIEGDQQEQHMTELPFWLIHGAFVILILSLTYSSALPFSLLEIAACHEKFSKYCIIISSILEFGAIMYGHGH